MKKQKNNTTISNAQIVNLFIGAVGVILILLAIIIPNEGVWFTISISIGTSVLSSAIVSGLSSKYLIKQNSINEMAEQWGIDGIYETRAEINSETNELLKNTKQLVICAMGLKNFRDAQSDLVRKRVSQGMSLKILTIDPKSSFLSVIDKNENKLEGSTKQSIESLVEWVNTLKELAVIDNQIEIRFYDNYPYDFYFYMDGTVFTGPYHAKASQQTITYKYRPKTKGSLTFIENFNVQWDKAKNA